MKQSFNWSRSAGPSTPNQRRPLHPVLIVLFLVYPVMTACTAILGLLPILVLQLHGTEIERPLAIVMTGGLVTSTLFTLLALPTSYVFAHRIVERVAARRAHAVAATDPESA